MDETAADHRFHNYHVILQPAFQRCRETSQDREEKGWHKSTYRNPCQRRCTFGHQVHLCGYQRFIHAKAFDFEQRGVIYVTKMKKNLKYSILSDTIYQTIYQTPNGLMEVRIQQVTFTKQLKNGETLNHQAYVITYVDEEKHKLISLLTNDMESDPSEIIAIYRKRWEIELLFKQMKQNFPLKYFYGENANAIMIQIWVTLIANLLLMIMQKGLTRSWSFSRLATMVRITLMYYVDFYSLFNHPQKDWESILEAASELSNQPSLFD